MTQIYLATDGAYKKGSAIYGWGFIIAEVNTTDNSYNVIESQSGSSNTHVKSNQIGGECEACIRGLKRISELYGDTVDVTIVYDYMGVEKWITGKFKASSDVAKDYVIAHSIIQSSFNLKFVHVNSHTTLSSVEHDLNRLVDTLASDAAQLQVAQNSLSMVELVTP